MENGVDEALLRFEAVFCARHVVQSFKYLPEPLSLTLMVRSFLQVSHFDCRLGTVIDVERSTVRTLRVGRVRSLSYPRGGRVSFNFAMARPSSTGVMLVIVFVHLEQL